MRSLFLAALLAAPSPLLAHAVLEPAAASPRTAYEGAVRIGHGCDGQPTREVRLTLPAGLTAPRALPLPGWEATVEGAEIVWRGTLAPDAKALFPFAAQVAADAPAMIDLPVAQICDGARIDWNGADADHPAPMLHLAGGAAPAHHHHGAEAPAPGGAAAVLGPLQLTGASSRATPPGAKVGAGYVTIANTGATPDRLIAARSPLAAEVQIHEMAMAGDVMQMRRLTEGVALPPGGKVALAPGGLHLMLLGLRQPLAEGATLPLTLTFETAGEVTLDLPILPRQPKP